MSDQPISKTGFQDQLALLTFVDTLIRDRKDPRVNEKNMPQIRELLLKEINEAVNTHLISLLRDKEQAELTVLLDKNATDDDLNAFFKKNILNFEVEMATALLNFRAAYIYPAQSAFVKQGEEVVKTAPQIVVPEKKVSSPSQNDDLGPPPPPAPVA